MKHLPIVLTLALVSIGFTGCRDFGSPRGVVKTAYHALDKGKAKLFTQTLTGNAFLEYGNLCGMVALQSWIEKNYPVMGQMVELSSNLYEIELLSKDQTIGQVVVSCEVMTVIKPKPLDREPHDTYLPCSTSSCVDQMIQTEDFTVCKISDIKVW